MKHWTEMTGDDRMLALAGVAIPVSGGPTNEECGYEECGCCGADVGRSSDWLWHYPWEDCRATRKPKEVDDE